MIVFGPRRQHHHPHAGSRQGPREARAAGRRRSASDHLGGARASARTAPTCCRSAPSSSATGSRTASNRSLQWGEQIVKPIFESKNDYEVMYLLAKKLGFADQMFKNIKVENDAPVGRGHPARDQPRRLVDRLLRPVAGAAQGRTWRTRRTSTWSRCGAEGRSGVGGDYYGLPWPCWGTPELKHPGTHMLYNTNLHVMDGGGTFRARFGVEREVKLADGSRARTTCWPRAPTRSARRSRTAIPSSPMGCSRSSAGTRTSPTPSMAVIERVGGNNPDGVSWATDLSGGIQRVAIEHGCIHYGNGKARAIAWNLPDPIPVHREPIYTPRPDLVAKYPTLPDAGAVPRAQHRLRRAEGRGRQGHRQAVPADPHLRPPGRIRGRRRGDPLQQVARRAAAGHVRRDQSGGRGRARHQGRRLGLGHGRRDGSAQGRG